MLVPICVDASAAWRVVIVRRAEGGIHGGQLAFPGGSRSDADATAVDTALREAGEEIGLTAGSVRWIRPLPEVETRVSNFRIAPFLALVERPAAWLANPAEIAEVLEPGLAGLLSPGALGFASDLMPMPWGPMHLPYYRIGRHRLWGVSERILTPLLARIAAGEWPEFAGIVVR